MCKRIKAREEEAEINQPHYNSDVRNRYINACTNSASLEKSYFSQHNCADNMQIRSFNSNENKLIEINSNEDCYSCNYQDILDLCIDLPDKRKHDGGNSLLHPFIASGIEVKKERILGIELDKFKRRFCSTLTYKKAFPKKKSMLINNLIFTRELNFEKMTRDQFRNISDYFKTHFKDQDIMIKCLIDNRKEIKNKILYDVEKIRPDSEFEQYINNVQQKHGAISFGLNFDELSLLPKYCPS